MDLNEINPSDIPDISELKIDRRKKERILDLLTKVENPYVFKVMDILTNYATPYFIEKKWIGYYKIYHYYAIIE